MCQKPGTILEPRWSSLDQFPKAYQLLIPQMSELALDAYWKSEHYSVNDPKVSTRKRVGAVMYGYDRRDRPLLASGWNRKSQPGDCADRRCAERHAENRLIESGGVKASFILICSWHTSGLHLDKETGIYSEHKPMCGSCRRERHFGIMHNKAVAAFCDDQMLNYHGYLLKDLFDALGAGLRP